MKIGTHAAVESQTMDEFAQVMAPGRLPSARRLALQPDEVKNGLGKLVLTLVELLRELLERQAIRRIDAGGLTPGNHFSAAWRANGSLEKIFRLAG